jgi:glycosyltransferase involved in cell wall biosynthesis
MGGGERLCCETIRALERQGHELTLISGDFDASRLEGFFGFAGLFEKVRVKTYPADPRQGLGTYKNLIHHARAQRKILSDIPDWDLVFSTQDACYVPDTAKPVIQWGYSPNKISHGLYGWPLRAYYALKIRRISLLLAISEYSKSQFDLYWKVPSKLVYPACNMIGSTPNKDNIVVTVARAVPEKRLELFWEVARNCADYKFVLLLTRDPRFAEYSQKVCEKAPSNGQVIVNPDVRAYQETLARSKVYLHLMRDEHFGIAVVESMSAGCVPIVHDSGGPKEIVDGCGYVWQNVDEIPMLLKAADKARESLSERSVERAKFFNREKFDVALGAALEEIISRVP